MNKINDLVKDYEDAKANLNAAVEERFPRGCVVRKDNVFGIVHAVVIDLPYRRAVLLENGNVWDYDVRTLEPVSERDVPSWITRTIEESLILEIKARALRVEWLHRMGIDDLKEIDEHMRNDPPIDPDEEMRQLNAIREMRGDAK